MKQKEEVRLRGGRLLGIEEYLQENLTQFSYLYHPFSLIFTIRMYDNPLSANTHISIICDPH